MGLRDRLAALLGLSAYQAPPSSSAPSLGDAMVERVREALGGQLSPLPQTRTRWYLRDIESAVRLADSGDMSMVSQLWRSMRRDGVISGLLATRTGGLVALPKKFYGDDRITKCLAERNGTRSLFDDMLPPSELALLLADGIGPGVGVAELVPVEGRDYPVLVRLDPEWLRYRWNENRWYYISIAGPIPITPGDGRWVLHTPGGRMAPWQHGLWQAIGRAWINKDHAFLHRSNWEGKLANPARAAIAPAGADETQRMGFLASVIAWGVNTVFEMPPGWDVKIIETSGRGYESFQATIDSSNLEFMVGIAGQTLTVDGGAGFSNGDVGLSIRDDLLKNDAVGLDYTINTQCLPPWIAARFGEAALDVGATVERDVTPPKDLKKEAESMNQMGQAIKMISEALTPYGKTLDIVQLTNRFGIPLAEPPAVTDDEESAPELPESGDEQEQVLQ